MQPAVWARQNAACLSRATRRTPRAALARPARSGGQTVDLKTGGACKTVTQQQSPVSVRRCMLRATPGPLLHDALRRSAGANL